MIRGPPLRKTGSAASHGGLSTELFYYKSGRLATGKKQMWRVSQKIHRGSLAFFGKWDKINRIRGDAPAPEVRRRAESPGHGFAVPAPFRQGGLGTGVRIATPVTGAEEIRVSFRDQSADWSWESVIPLHKGRGERIATASVRTGFAMTHYKKCGTNPAVARPHRTTCNAPVGTDVTGCGNPFLPPHIHPFPLLSYFPPGCARTIHK